MTMMLNKISYYWRIIKWMHIHRAEPSNRQKWRRMLREIQLED